MRDKLNKRLTDASRAILDVNDPANRVRLAELEFNFAMHIALLSEDALEFFDDEGDVHFFFSKLGIVGSALRGISMANHSG